MKTKNARRWLVRNQVSNAKKRLAGMKIKGFEKTCKKILRHDAKTNSDSRRVFNQLYIQPQLHVHQ